MVPHPSVSTLTQVFPLLWLTVTLTLYLFSFTITSAQSMAALTGLRGQNMRPTMRPPLIPTLNFILVFLVLLLLPLLVMPLSRVFSRFLLPFNLPNTLAVSCYGMPHRLSLMLSMVSALSPLLRPSSPWVALTVSQVSLLPL